MHLISALRDCKQRSLTVSKKAPTVSKKASPLFHACFYGVSYDYRAMRCKMGYRRDVPACQCVKLSAKGGGVSHHFWGVLTSPKKYRAIWGIAAIASQYRAIWGH